MVQAGTVESYVLGFTASGWTTTPTNVHDNNTATYAQSASVSGPAWTTKLTINLTVVCSGTKMRYWVSQSTAGTFTIMNITVANQTGTWQLVYSGTPTEGSYQNVSFTSVSYTAIGIQRYRASGTTARYARANEVHGINVLSLPEPPGESTVNVYAPRDSAFLWVLLIGGPLTIALIFILKKGGS